MGKVRSWLTEDSQRRRIAITAIIAAYGSAVGFSVDHLTFGKIFWTIWPPRVTAAFDFLVNPEHFWTAWTAHVAVAVFAAIGAAVPGYFVAGWFGRSGKDGWMIALAAAFLCTVIGGVLGSMLIVPGFGTLFGRYMVSVFLTRIELILIWTICFVLAQLLIIRIRRKH